MAAKPKASAATVALYEKMIASQAGIARKGAANPYTSMNGNMFSFLTEKGVALRLPDELREELIAKKKGKACIQYNCVMRGYVEFPQAILKKTAQINKLFAQSVAYAKTLPAKPTKKSPKKAKKKVKKKATTKKKASKRRS